MSASQIDHLVKMANQIALNLAAAGDDDTVAEQAYDHMKRFWSPLMKQQITAYLEKDVGDLTPASAKAVAKLAESA